MKYYITCSTQEEPTVYLTIKANNEQQAIKNSYKQYKNITSIKNISTTKFRTPYNSLMRSLQTHALAGNTVTQLIK
jgi:hypothetical protein